MVDEIPVFQVKISEGMVDADTSKTENSFVYCIESKRGPINTPVFVTSNKEAQRIFGKDVDFAPHFYQNPEGLYIVRVGFKDGAKGKIIYSGKKGSGEAKTLLEIESRSIGVCDDIVAIKKAGTVGGGWNVSVNIDGITSKNYVGIPSLKRVARKINLVYSDFLKASIDEDNYVLEDDADYEITSNSDDESGNVTGKLINGTQGYMLKADGTKTTYTIEDTGKGLDKDLNDTTVSANKTLYDAYKDAFNASLSVDVIGVATLSPKIIVRNTLVEHIKTITDPENHEYRFGVVGLLDGDKGTGKTEIDSSDIATVVQDLNSEWIILIGQGVKFLEDGKSMEEVKELKPYQAVQLYTGIRSSLGYSEAIFGGESKKVLRGVIDTIPVYSNINKEHIIQLNESGVCTFKREYGEVTFLEGVTTVQGEERQSDVMTYENLMSIVAHVAKSLVRIAKPYQGQRLTEDLKSTLQTALSAELKSITEVDGTLMAIEEYNIPPYDVQVYSAGKTRFDETNRHLIRESKIIIRCRIVPVGALRDIDLGIMVI